MEDLEIFVSPTMSQKTNVPTHQIQIFVGLRKAYSDVVFDIQRIYDLCQSYCDAAGFCVTVSPTRFIYKNGFEPGAVVGLINYPRFPSTLSDLQLHAETIAEIIKLELEQTRVTIVFSDGLTKMLGPVEVTKIQETAVSPDSGPLQ